MHTTPPSAWEEHARLVGRSALFAGHDYLFAGQATLHLQGNRRRFNSTFQRSRRVRVDTSQHCCCRVSQWRDGCFVRTALLSYVPLFYRPGDSQPLQAPRWKIHTVPCNTCVACQEKNPRAKKRTMRHEEQSQTKQKKIAHYHNCTNNSSLTDRDGQKQKQDRQWVQPAALPASPLGLPRRFLCNLLLLLLRQLLYHVNTETTQNKTSASTSISQSTHLNKGRAREAVQYPKRKRVRAM